MSQPEMPEYLVALSFAEEHRDLVTGVAEILAAALGKDRLFFYPFHQPWLARPDLNLELQRIYSGSRLVVAFLDSFHPVKEWCRMERRVLHDLIKRGQGGRVMLIKLEDVDDPEFLSIDGWLPAWDLGPDTIAAAILERLRAMEDGTPASGPLTYRVTRPGLARYLFDRAVPRLHGLLTDLGTLPEPVERAELAAWLRDLRSGLENEIHEKTYLPLRARNVPRGALAGRGRDPFVRPIQHVIRQVLGRAEGGDSASAQIAAVNRRSRQVRNIVHALARSEDPLVLLGDPGSGKTMTLQETVLALAAREARRVFPG